MLDSFLVFVQVWNKILKVVNKLGNFKDFKFMFRNVCLQTLSWNKLDRLEKRQAAVIGTKSRSTKKLQSRKTFEKSFNLKPFLPSDRSYSHFSHLCFYTFLPFYLHYVAFRIICFQRCILIDIIEDK